MNRKAKVLVVDDDLDIREAIKVTVEPKGYIVYQANNGKEGLKLADMEAPDLVITDISMPDMDGIEFIKRLSIRKRRLPIIAMSGNLIGKQFFRAAKVFGAVETLLKPFTSKKLMETMNKALS